MATREVQYISGHKDKIQTMEQNTHASFYKYNHCTFKERY
jgi:hypothetical protein